MPFGKSFERNKGTGEGQVKDNPYMRTKEGSYIIRVLDEDALSFYDYWMKVNVNGAQTWRSVVVGRNNPIREYMNGLGEDHPQFAKPRKRFVINVLNRTMVKLRPSTGEPVFMEKNKFPPAVEGESIENVVAKPYNKVQILEFGPQVADLFMMLHNEVHDPKDLERLMAIQDFDLQYTVRGAGLEKKTMIIQSRDTNALPPELARLPRYDLAKLKAPLPNEAAQKLLDGVDYGEVMDSLGFTRGEYPMIDPIIVADGKTVDLSREEIPF